MSRNGSAFLPQAEGKLYAKTRNDHSRDAPAAHPRGKPAVIREANGCRQTTPVLWVDNLSSTEVTFETQNTVYHLRVMAVLREEEAQQA